jgi:hypothetical protein
VSHDGDQVVIIPLPPESLAPDGDGDRLAWEAEREGAHVFGLLMDGLPMETVAQLLAFGDLDPSIAREYLAMVAEGVETAAARASEGLSPGEEEKAMALAEKAREALRKAAGRDKGAQPAGARESQGSPAPQKGQGEARFGELRLDALNRVALCLCRPGLAMSGSARWETARDICVNSLGTLWANEGKFTRFLREAKRVCEGQILLRQGQGALCQAGWERLEVSVHNALLLVVDAGRQLGYPGYLFPSGLAGESPYAHVPLAPKREGDAPGRVLTLAGIGQREFRVAGEGEAPRGYGVLREGSDELIALFRGEGNAADFAWSLCRPDTPMLRQFQDEEFEAQFRGRLPVAEAIQWDSLPIDIDQPDLSPWYHPDGSPKGFGDVLDWPPTLGPTEPGPGNGRDGQGSIRPRQ